MFQNLINQAMAILGLNPTNRAPQSAIFQLNKDFDLVIELRKAKSDVQFRIVAHESGDRKTQQEHIKTLRRDIRSCEKPNPWYPLHKLHVSNFLANPNMPSWVAVWKDSIMVSGWVDGVNLEDLSLSDSNYVNTHTLPKLKEAIKYF